MRILVTGIAGFVGSSLTRAILKKSALHEITGIDNFSFGYKERLSELGDKIEFVECDVSQLTEKFGGRMFDLIVHCAAIAPLPECQKSSAKALTQNVAMCGSVVDFALLSGSRNIIFMSSGAVYEGTTIFPTHEDVTIKTQLIYPTTKYLAEQYFDSMCRSHDLNVTSIRLMNLYGPHQDYFRKQPPLIGYLLSSLIKDKDATLYSDGAQMRDYIYIDDLLDLMLLLAEKMLRLENAGSHLVLNAGSGKSISVNKIIETIENLAGAKIRVKRCSAVNYWDKYEELFKNPITINRCIIESEVNKYTQASIAKANSLLGWSPRVNIKKGLVECLKHAKEIIK